MSAASEVKARSARRRAKVRKADTERLGAPCAHAAIAARLPTSELADLDLYTRALESAYLRALDLKAGTAA